MSAARRLLAVSADRRFSDGVGEALPAGEFAPVDWAPDAACASRMLAATSYDILLINSPLPDATGVELALTAAETAVGVLFLCKKQDYARFFSVLEERGVPVLTKPVPREVFDAALRLSVAVRVRLGRMERRNRTLETKMTDIRAVDRAKWLLIENLNMTERDAHYYIEKQAMDLRISRREVAEHIIRTYDGSGNVR